MRANVFFLRKMYNFAYSFIPVCMLFMEHTEESVEEVWRRLFVPDNLIQALIKASFLRPTPIQSCVLPAAIRDHSDILGSAPTVGLCIILIVF